MKIIISFLFAFLLASCANGKERIFIASTPINSVLRTFLGIPLADSIDFIRWRLRLNDNSYRLYCNYGISKPNTNGFISSGKKIELSGSVAKEKNYYQLKNGSSILNIIELNDNLLHLLSTDRSLLVGNGGWSYTLNNINPAITDEINLQAKQSLLKDSIVFDGRTPCNIPGVIIPGTECYKLKWRIILYADKKKNDSGNYKILGTAWRKENGQTGNWAVLSGKNGRIIYQLKDNKGTTVLHLLKADENILLFTDANGNLLTGDEDFSYTLNRM